MQRALLNKPYVNLTSYLDMQAFDQLHSEICRGFVLAKTKNLSYRGNLSLDKIDQEQVNLEIYNGTVRPIWYRYEEYMALPEDHPIKLSASGLNQTELALYLKYAMGAYDPYQVFPLFTHQESMTRELSTIAELFSNVIKWIDATNVFTHISKAYFLLLEPDGISIEHSDPADDPTVLREFIHIRSDVDRPFYIKKSKNSEKIYIDARACYFNDQDWHGGEGVRKSSYTLRIDGTFTEEIKKNLICISE